MSLPRSQANAHTKYLRSYGIQSQAYAQASYTPGSQIARKPPPQEVNPLEKGVRGGAFTPLFSLRQPRFEGRGGGRQKRGLAQWTQQDKAKDNFDAVALAHLGWMSATYNNVVPLQAVLDKEESHIGSKDVACLQHTTISKIRTRRDR